MRKESEGGAGLSDGYLSGSGEQLMCNSIRAALKGTFVYV